MCLVSIGGASKLRSNLYLFLFIAVPIATIDGVVGNKAQLPCDIRSAENDEVSMVLWYKEGGNEPIYR